MTNANYTKVKRIEELGKVDGNYFFKGDLEISGAINVKNCSLNVTGNLLLSGNEISIQNGNLEVAGNVECHTNTICVFGGKITIDGYLYHTGSMILNDRQIIVNGDMYADQVIGSVVTIVRDNHSTSIIAFNSIKIGGKCIPREADGDINKLKSPKIILEKTQEVCSIRANDLVVEDVKIYSFSKRQKEPMTKEHVETKRRFGRKESVKKYTFSRDLAKASKKVVAFL